MKSRWLTIAAMVCLMAFPSISGAAVLDFAILAQNAGSIAYTSDSLGKTLSGTGIDVASVVGLGTPLHAGNPPQALTLGRLEFETTYSDTWNFGAGGFINIYSADPSYSGLLLTGVFQSAQIISGSLNHFKLAGSSFLNWVDPDLAAYYGLTGGPTPWSGNFGILFETPADLNQEFATATIYGGGVTTAPVPEPGTMMLLGSGLAGLAGCGRRRFRK
jgi:hypothetical protein